MKIKNQNKLYCMISFLLCFLPRVIMGWNMYPLIVGRDEASTIVGAAFFAGYDWSNVIGNGGFYYGCGYTMLFAPLFKMIDSPFLLYKAILLGSALLFALIAPVSYHLAHHYFKVQKPKLLLAISVACSYMIAGTVGPVAMNEAPLIMMVWLIAWILLKLINVEKKKDKVFYTILLFIPLSYSLMLHARAIMLWAGLFIVIIIYYIINREWIVSRIATMLAGSVGYCGAQAYISYVQDQIWNNGAAVTQLANSNLGVPKTVFELLSQGIAWKSILFTILGQLNTITIYTAGFSVICVILCILKIKGYLCNENRDNVSKGIFVLFVYFAVCVAATIGGQSITWLTGGIDALQAGKGTDAYGFRAFTYIRYFGCYVGPLLLCGFVELIRLLSSKLKKYVKIFAGTIIGLQIPWLLFIVPYLQNSNAAVDIFTALSMENWNDAADIWVYLSGTVALLLIGSMILYLIWENKKTIAIVILGIFLMFESIYLYGTYVSKSHANIASVDAGNYLYNQLKESNILIDKIYVENLDSAYYYQVMLMKCQIMNESPGTDEDNVMLFTNNYEDIERYVDKGYLYCILDDNEIVIVKGKEYENAIKRLGYILE